MRSTCAEIRRLGSFIAHVGQKVCQCHAKCLGYGHYVTQAWI
ncbi:hypothetical protein GA0061078_0004 [Bifidobacterium bohemicum]|uniref:Uncharacterized protein n=1 Tax=Bifidobacterium bohemicum DSM 22767 TaxID=1437606 RepID=A0A086ZDZ7_9BIFI|nr:hypothetical protein BBOH_1472 [Bifidobacterium bohemicum DSM 22767]SCC17465.1 hypothetical protein GA0061078_0004 [Bifidobacterium bohemicum]